MTTCSGSVRLHYFIWFGSGAMPKAHFKVRFFNCEVHALRSKHLLSGPPSGTDLVNYLYSASDGVSGPPMCLPSTEDLFESRFHDNRSASRVMKLDKNDPNKRPGEGRGGSRRKVLTPRRVHFRKKSQSVNRTLMERAAENPATGLFLNLKNLKNIRSSEINLKNQKNYPSSEINLKNLKNQKKPKKPKKYP